MTHPADLPYPVPEPHEWVDEPEPGVARAFDDAMDEVREGRSAILPSEDALDALLAEMVADPRTEPKAS